MTLKESVGSFESKGVASNCVGRILILAANPKMTTQLRLDEEVREIRNCLKRSSSQHAFDVQARFALRGRDVQEAMLEYKPQIVHFSGHGTENGLLVEDALGFGFIFSKEAIADLFRLCSDNLDCVILNACYTDSLASEISRNIDYVIGMTGEIQDKASVEFSVGFYSAISAGESIENAFKFGRSALLREFPGKAENKIPVLKIKEGVKEAEQWKKVKTDMVEIFVRVETTGDVYSAHFCLDQSARVVKMQLLSRLGFPSNNEKGQVISYCLMSRTRDRLLDERKTLRENGVREGEVLVVLLEVQE